MVIYQVSFENFTAVSAVPVNNLQHNELGLTADKKSLRWIALECPDAATALEIGNSVLRMLWMHDAA